MNSVSPACFRYGIILSHLRASVSEGPREERLESERRDKTAEFVLIRSPAHDVLPRFPHGRIEYEAYDRERRTGLLFALDELLSDGGGKAALRIPGGLEDAFQVPVRLQQVRRGLLADAWDALEVVRRIAPQRLEIRDLVRGQARQFL